MQQPNNTAEPQSRAATGLHDWNDIVSDAFFGTVVDAPESRFSGELTSCRVNDINLIRIRADRSKVGRWLSARPCKSSGSVFLHLQAFGESVNEQRGRRTTLEPGNGALCDPDIRYTVDFLKPYEMFVVELSIADVLAREPGFDLDRFAGQRMENRRSQLLLAFLRTAWMQRDCLDEDADWRDCVSRTSRDLALRAISEADEFDVFGAAADLRHAVIDHIRKHLCDPELRTSTVARALGISARSVQTVFERLATTASGFILEQRLALAADRLRHAPGERSITELAYDCGFSDSAYFSRCFSRSFGMPPRLYRRSGPRPVA